jgi:uncharacterized membrane protein
MAGEMETLDQDEPLAKRIERHDYDRLAMLSDGVFAIAITLLALELPLPAHWDGHYASLVGVAGRALIGYIFAFGMVGAFWVAHRRLLVKLARVDQVTTLLTLALLGLVGLAPYVARLIAETGPSRAMPVYFVAVASVFGMMGLIRLWATAKPTLLHREIDRRTWARDALAVLAGAVIIGGFGAYSMAAGRPVSANEMLMVVAGSVIVRQLIRRLKPKVAIPAGA